jgi:hypothetical protein
MKSVELMGMGRVAVVTRSASVVMLSRGRQRTLGQT